MAPMITANHVGAYFFREYYRVLLYDPHNIHHFYSDNSTMTRVDGISSETASDKLQIDALLKSLNFAAIDIKTINSLYSWDGGVLVMASGLVKIKDLSARRKFFQCIFLAPQESGYFVLNDIFQFTDDGETHPIEGSVASEKNDTQQPHPSTTPAEAPALDHSLEEEASKYVESTHIEDDPVDKHGLAEHQQTPPQQHDLETGAVRQLETPAEDASSSGQSTDTIHERHRALVEELLEEEEPQKTYASVLQAPRPPNSQLNHVARRAAQQQSSASNIDPESGFERVPPPPEFEEGGKYYRRVTRKGNFRGKRYY